MHRSIKQNESDLVKLKQWNLSGVATDEERGAAERSQEQCLMCRVDLVSKVSTY